MALEPCRECGTTISTAAKFCPHCGATASTASARGRRVARRVILVSAVLFLGFVVLIRYAYVADGSEADSWAPCQVTYALYKDALFNRAWQAVDAGKEEPTPLPPRVARSELRCFWADLWPGGAWRLLAP